MPSSAVTKRSTTAAADRTGRRKGEAANTRNARHSSSEGSSRTCRNDSASARQARDTAFHSVWLEEARRCSSLQKEASASSSRAGRSPNRASPSRTKDALTLAPLRRKASTARGSSRSTDEAVAKGVPWAASVSRRTDAACDDSVRHRLSFSTAQSLDTATSACAVDTDRTSDCTPASQRPDADNRRPSGPSPTGTNLLPSSRTARHPDGPSGIASTKRGRSMLSASAGTSIGAQPFTPKRTNVPSAVTPMVVPLPARRLTRRRPLAPLLTRNSGTGGPFPLPSCPLSDAPAPYTTPNNDRTTV
mmetsp:Transcript_5454/g.17644  ORF Transcript_5454/g.17644 Transcript_5454/m.17644 type:complete len:304 (+) Transcript_5454:1592-2503(+)